jgi:hypothetical protein
MAIRRAAHNMIQFGRWLLRAWALKLAGWLQRVAGNSHDHTTRDVAPASFDSVPSQPGEPPVGAPQPGGPPPHWVEKVKKAAPHLLQPGRPNFAVPVRSAKELPSRLRRQPRHRDEAKSTPAMRRPAFPDGKPTDVESTVAKPGRQRQAPVQRTGGPSRSFLKFRAEAPRTSGPVTTANEPVDRPQQSSPQPGFMSGGSTDSVSSISYPPRPERPVMKPPDPEMSPSVVRDTTSPRTQYHDPILRREETGLDFLERSNQVEVRRHAQSPPDAPPPRFIAPDPRRRPNMRHPSGSSRS